MGQNRKKAAIQHDKLLVAQAEYRKKFIRKVEICLNALTGKKIFNSLTERQLTEIYNIRYSQFRIHKPKDCTVSDKWFNTTEKLIQVMIEHTAVRHNGVEYPFTVHDYFVVIRTLEYHFCSGKNAEKAENIEIDALIAPLICSEEFISSCLFLLLHTLSFVANSESYFDKVFYSLSYKPDVISEQHRNGSSVRIINNINLSVIPIQKREIMIDGVLREIFRVGHSFYTEFIWLSVQPSKLKVKSSTQLEVYIQKHALNRLEERLDGCPYQLMHYYLIQSIKTLNFHGDTTDRFLIEYIYEGIKVGYLGASIIEDVLVIRTFLFITNSGTPESRLLEKYTGLQKLDKKYLAIDKLSSFLSDKLSENTEVRDILSKAGCQNLVEMYDHLKHYSKPRANKEFSVDALLRFVRANQQYIKDYEAATVVEVDD